MPFSSAIVRSPILEIMGGERPFTTATNPAMQYYAGKSSAVTYASASTLLKVEGLQPSREQVRNIGHVRDSLMLNPAVETLVNYSPHTGHAYRDLAVYVPDIVNKPGSILSYDL
jgi:hypothetical protein